MSTGAVQAASRARTEAKGSAAADDDAPPDVAGWLRVLMFTIAVLICLGVAGIGGWRSFTAVSVFFGSWTVPVIADGLVVGTTATRLAALTRGWRVPGSVLLTVFSLGGTVWLNIHASPGKPIDQFSHAIAPIAYLVLMEMLAYVLKLQLKLRVQAKARLTLIGWLVSPVVTTRAWLLMQRTGEKDPSAARALIQQSIRARSQLLIICPSPWWRPFGAASRARAAALQTVRDGVLSAADVIELLPVGHVTMRPVELLIAVNRRAVLGVPNQDFKEDTAVVPAARIPGPRPEATEHALASADPTRAEPPLLTERTAPRFSHFVGHDEQVALNGFALPEHNSVDDEMPLNDDTDEAESMDDGLGEESQGSGTPEESAAEQTLTEPVEGTARALFELEADRMVAAERDERPLSEDNRVRIAAAREIDSRLGLGLADQTIRKYAQRYFARRAGRGNGEAQAV